MPTDNANFLKTPCRFNNAVITAFKQNILMLRSQTANEATAKMHGKNKLVFYR